jgi:hypothetical protein
MNKIRNARKLLNACLKDKGGLGPKSLRGNRFYKDHKTIVEKSLYHFKTASIPLKMYLKRLEILEKDSISLEKSSKTIDIFI